jgi:uncharacterized RDD family membrane protein YckC
MSDREPALLGEPRRNERLRSHGTEGTEGSDDSQATEPSFDAMARADDTDPMMPMPSMPHEFHDPRGPALPPPLGMLAQRSRREPAAVFVVGFWRRLAAAAIDLAAVIPPALLITLIASWLTGLHMPTNLRLLDIDLWIDLVLARDPALVMALVLFCAISLVYLLVFQIASGHTLGMRILKMKIIDVYGEPPSAARCLARCGGYLAGFATLFLGFLWMGFDSEKRGLQDWIAGTYVIRA